MGLAHLSCLVWQAEASVKEKEEWNTGEGIRKWAKCFDCGQRFHGVVKLALGWACWKTYLGRPQTDAWRRWAIFLLGNAISVSKPEDAFSVFEANLTLLRRYWPHDLENILITQGRLVDCLSKIGRQAEALNLKREIYAETEAMYGAVHKETLAVAYNLAVAMELNNHNDEAVSFMRKHLPVARRLIGPDDSLTLLMSAFLAKNTTAKGCTYEELLQAVTLMQDTVQRLRRVFGLAHPETRRCEAMLSRMLDSATTWGASGRT